MGNLPCRVALPSGLNERPVFPPRVRSIQLRATSWTTNSSARVMTTAATAPDRAPERDSASPITKATMMVKVSATIPDCSGVRSISANPNGALGICRSFRSGEMAQMAKV